MPADIDQNEEVFNSSLAVLFLCFLASTQAKGLL